MNITEKELRSWCSPASDTEEGRCDRTILSITKCLNDADFTKYGLYDVFLRGSYKNNTNVKRNSDVDMYVFFNEFGFEIDRNWRYISDNSSTGPSYSEFKNAVAQVLINKYGSSGIKIGNKSIKVKASSSAIDADIVPVISLRFNGKDIGVCFCSKDGNLIFNFPSQDETNGISKNKNTGYRYKWFVRIFKALRNKLKDEGVLLFDIPSYVIESLLYNVPDNLFTGDSYLKILEDIVVYIYSNIENQQFMEVNGIKRMFMPSLFKEQTTTIPEIKSFLQNIISDSYWEVA